MKLIKIIKSWFVKKTNPPVEVAPRGVDGSHHEWVNGQYRRVE